MIPYATQMNQNINTSYQERRDFDYHQPPSMRVRTGIRSGNVGVNGVGYEECETHCHNLGKEVDDFRCICDF